MQQSPPDQASPPKFQNLRSILPVCPGAHRFGRCATISALICSYAAGGRIPRVVNWFFAVYGRPAITRRAYASPIPGNAINCPGVAVLMSSKSVDAAIFSAIVSRGAAVVAVCAQALTGGARDRKKNSAATTVAQGPNRAITKHLLEGIPAVRTRSAPSLPLPPSTPCERNHRAQLLCPTDFFHAGSLDNP
jgi:hypothetical protein